MKFFIVLTGLFVSLSLQAQEVEMADAMRANGKIYVVVAIVFCVLVGFIGYLIRLDRKISRLEKELKNK